MFNIYMVQKCSDMTEGRGGMVDVIAFETEEDAWTYANSQLGIMGRVPSTGDWRTHTGGSDWDVKTVEVWGAGEYSPEEEAKRQKILAKLTPEERKILGV